MSHLTRCAPLAIAATLALGSTPLSAQDAAAPAASTAPPPVIVLPAPAPAAAAPVAAPAPAPVIVIPEELTRPAAEPAAPQPAARAAPRQAAPPRAAAPRPAAAAPAAPEPAAVTDPSPDTPVSDTTALDDPTLTTAAPLPVDAVEPELAASATDDTPATDNTLAVILAGIAALGFALLMVLLLRRRRPKTAAAAPRIERPVVAARETSVPEGTAAPEFAGGLEPEPVRSADRAHYTNPGAPFVAASSAHSNLSHAGAAVALPRELPATAEERDALIKRMVDAAPDRANPFRSRRARGTRARLILASLGRDFKDADPWIDLSQYPSNWPELARRQAAAA